MTTDVNLQRKVLEELDWEPSVDAAHIGVTARDGVVTLSGHIEVYAEKQAAEETTKRVHGVKAVANEIEVRPGDEHQRDDEDIATAAVAALQWNAKVPAERLQVTVREGWITLEGTVARQHEKLAAQRTLRHFVGARGVTNKIQVEPWKKAAAASGTRPVEAKSQIEAAFRRSAIVNSKAVGVEIQDHIAILTGDVHSHAEMDEAARIAWAAPGVSDVDNEITITPWGYGPADEWGY